MSNEKTIVEEASEPERIDPATGLKDNFVIDDDFSYAGYQITREEYFAHAREPALTIVGNKLYLNKACYRNAPDVIRIQILINAEQKKIGIKPCSEEKKDSMQWVTDKGNIRQLRCKPILCMQIVEITGWNLNNRHRMIGKLIRNKGERLFVFSMDSAMIYPSKQQLDADGNVLKTTFSKDPLYNESWQHQFGLPVEEHERIYAVNRFDGFVTVSVQDRMVQPKSRPSLNREEPENGSNQN